MSSSTQSKLSSKDDDDNVDIFIFDGGTGREIERCGGPFRQPEWSALALYEKPDVVRHVHERFLQAGARAITTNTYALVPFHIGDERYKNDAKRLLRLAVDLAHEAVTNYTHQQQHLQGSDDDGLQIEKPKILGSIPPVCGSYEPSSFKEDVAGPIIRDFLDVLGNDTRVDILILETVGSIQEAAFYLRRIQEFYNDSKQLEQPQSPSSVTINPSSRLSSPPIWLSFCTKAGDGSNTKPQLLSGETIGDGINALSKEGLLSEVEVILINCCDIRLVKDSIREIKTAVSLLSDDSSTSSSQSRPIRIGCYPNGKSNVS
jgi:S-methylmethionine-dependent homocysteine/selenocysteine methylase